LIVQVNNESDLQMVLKLCSDAAVPVTFKAGGTSLSGQTITNEILIEIGPGFTKYIISDEGKLAAFQPGVNGAYANLLLSRYNRKIGPSPASINAAKIGGIVANNASGASYGIATNSYNTIRAMRIIFHDGTILDTCNEESRTLFVNTHPILVQKLRAWRNYIISDDHLHEKIRSKYQLKNTCGYGVNALIDFDDPIDMISHLMIGSEGTLGFISEVTFQTLEDFPLKACALLFFPDVRTATRAIMPLRQCKVSAAELMDRKSLRSVENNAGLPSVIQELGNDVAALLIETSASSESELELQMEEIREKLNFITTLFPITFTRDKKEFQSIWKVRKGLFTSAAAARPKGTACIIEDVAFPGESLGNALTDLQGLLCRHQYQESVIWGHLLDGNIHFLISPDFQEDWQMDNYKSFMHELATLVVKKYNGSLKAEHGTGRNMAPFVKYEWGEEIYEIMRQIKMAFDPSNILNPGVLINSDPQVFAKNIKSFSLSHPMVDDCIECGFCERNCPSRELTLTPRQRIVAFRELTRMKKEGENKTLKELTYEYSYHGEESCATDGLCALDCPVEINTGKLMKELRFEKKGKLSLSIASFVAHHFGIVVNLVRVGLGIVSFFQKVLPTTWMKAIGTFLHKASYRTIPLWNEFMPGPAPRIRKSVQQNVQIRGRFLPSPLISEQADSAGIQAPEVQSQPNESAQQFTVVYFPACINRIFGVSAKENEKISVFMKTSAVLEKAGYKIVYPGNISELCCGMAFDSKGFKEQGWMKLKELEVALLEASDNGKFPVLCDMSPCLLRMREFMDKRLKLYEPVGFTMTYLSDHLIFHKLPIQVAVHATCSTTKMGLDDQLVKLVGLCAEVVVKPEKTSCCGWAGDKGFNLPELNKSALKYLKEELPEGLEGGYSNSRTCEIGLSLYSSITYKSVMYLVDRATMPK
jgi:D-lactate dehydrogenase